MLFYGRVQHRLNCIQPYLGKGHLRVDGIVARQLNSPLAADGRFHRIGSKARGKNAVLRGCRKVRVAEVSCAQSQGGCRCFTVEIEDCELWFVSRAFMEFKGS